MRSAMGKPGSETALEETMCQVLGDSLQDGTVTKLADYLYCGGYTTDELFSSWERVFLQALQKCSLRLSLTKTVICLLINNYIVVDLVRRKLISQSTPKSIIINMPTT